MGAILFLASLIGCSERVSTETPKSTQTGTALSAPELERLQKAAAQGDGRAAFDLYGYYYFEQEDEVKGLYWLQAAVTLQDPDALCVIGQIRLNEGRYEEALKYLQEGSKLAHKRGPATLEHCEGWLKEAQRHAGAATPRPNQ
jgi:tetratricopeptide (TPR) repeat protein